MRIALITLAVAALGFIGSIIWMFAQKNGINLNPSPTSPLKISDETAAIEMLKSQWKTEEKIKTLEAKIDALSGNGSPSTPVSQTGGQTGIGSSSGSSVMNDTRIIPISAKFLGKVISKVSPILDKNNGIYGLYIFDTSTEYSTYIDTKYQMTIVASRTPFESFKKNFSSLDKTLYTINPVTNTVFGFPAFYINPPKADNWVRVALQVESQTLFITLPKTKFNEFKTLLTKK